MKLDDERLTNADEAFSLYDFGEENVKECGGWEFVEGSDTWSRVLFFDGARKTFVIRFVSGSKDVDEAFVMD